jgi:hypothetical protein
VAASAATLVLGSTLLKSSPARVRSAAGRATVTASPR